MVLYHVFHKNIKQKNTDFILYIIIGVIRRNIYEHQISILEFILKDRVTLKIAENSALVIK